MTGVERAAARFDKAFDALPVEVKRAWALTAWQAWPVLEAVLQRHGSKLAETSSPEIGAGLLDLATALAFRLIKGKERLVESLPEALDAAPVFRSFIREIAGALRIPAGPPPVPQIGPVP